MLLCKICLCEKADSEFYASNRVTCKDCYKARVRAYREENLDRIQAYDRMRGSLPHRLELVKANAGKYPQSSKAWRKRHPEKYRAHVMVNNGLRDGRLERRDTCENCLSAVRPVQAHHDDYSRPLDVVWLCHPCHMRWHKVLNALARGAA